MREIKVRVIFNNGDVKYATLQELKNGLLKSKSYPIKYHLFIGLKDKNKLEIYEGDIINNEFVVEFVAPSFMLHYKNISWWNFDEIEEPLEVTGNIYENPKRLEEVE